LTHISPAAGDFDLANVWPAGERGERHAARIFGELPLAEGRAAGGDEFHVICHQGKHAIKIALRGRVNPVRDHFPDRHFIFRHYAPFLAAEASGALRYPIAKRQSSSSNSGSSMIFAFSTTAERIAPRTARTRT